MINLGYYRFAAVSSDMLVFVCEDDLWSVPRSGGIARRLTTSTGEISLPRFSPDGTQLAFVAREEGNPEVYVMPSGGGLATRLTFLGSDVCSISGWSPDGMQIYFCSDAGAPFAHYFVDLERRYVSANKRFAEMVGVNLERLIGRRVEEIYPDGLPYVVADLEAVVTGRRLASRECLMPNGRMVMSTAAAARDEDDEVVGMSVALIDITKYKRPPAPELERAKSPINGDKPLLDGKERQNADALGGRRS